MVRIRFGLVRFTKPKDKILVYSLGGWLITVRIHDNSLYLLNFHCQTSGKYGIFGV